MGGLHVLSYEYLYAFKSVDWQKYFKPNGDSQKLFDQWKSKALNIHLFSSSTNSKQIMKGSTMDILMERFGLFMHRDFKFPMRLQAPDSFKVHKSQVPLALQRFHVVILQYAREGRHPATIKVTTRFGFVSMPPQSDVANETLSTSDSKTDEVKREQGYEPTRMLMIELEHASVADVNWMLNRLYYTSMSQSSALEDEIVIECVFGGEYADATIQIDNKWI